MKIGTNTTGNIIKESGVKNAHIYEILEKLIEKGLVSYFISKNKKHFQATNPQNLLRLYEKQKNEFLKKEISVKQRINELIQQQDSHEEENEIRIYEGLQGIKNAINKMLDILQAKETYYVIGAPIIGNKKLNGFFEEVHKERMEKEIEFKIIYDLSAKEFALKRKKDKFTQVRIANTDSPTEMCTFNDYAQIIIFSKKPILIEIKNKDLAKSVKEYFNIIWMQSKQV